MNNKIVIISISLVFLYVPFNVYGQSQTTEEIAEEGARNIIEVRKHIIDMTLALEECASYSQDFDLGLETDVSKLKSCVDYSKLLNQAFRNITSNGVIDTILYGD
jgi:hypothetical protein